MEENALTNLSTCEAIKSETWAHIIKSHIIHTICNMLKTRFYHEEETVVLDIALWSQIFNSTQVKYPLIYCSGLVATLSPMNAIYPSKTFQEYVDSIATLQKMGSYDYMEFCNSMKNPDFNKSIFNKYQKMEKINALKNVIIDEIMHPTAPACPYNPQYIDSYIRENSIVIPQQKPDCKMFRNKMNSFYEKYTLWEIYHQIKKIE